MIGQLFTKCFDALEDARKEYNLALVKIGELQMELIQARSRIIELERALERQIQETK